MNIIRTKSTVLALNRDSSRRICLDWNSSHYWGFIRLETWCRVMNLMWYHNGRPVHLYILTWVGPSDLATFIFFVIYRFAVRWFLYFNLVMFILVWNREQSVVHHIPIDHAYCICLLWLSLDTWYPWRWMSGWQPKEIKILMVSQRVEMF